MGPCTYLVTNAAVSGASVPALLRETLAGPGGASTLYTGAGAVAARQATNWASRQGLTELCQAAIPEGFGVAGAILGGCLGGIGSCWNTPLEVARIRAQAGDARGLVNVLRDVWATEGLAGCFRGVTPRALQAAWQTCFMVVAPQLLAAQA